MTHSKIWLWNTLKWVSITVIIKDVQQTLFSNSSNGCYRDNWWYLLLTVMTLEPRTLLFCHYGKNSRRFKYCSRLAFYSVKCKMKSPCFYKKWQKMWYGSRPHCKHKTLRSSKNWNLTILSTRKLSLMTWIFLKWLEAFLV